MTSDNDTAPITISRRIYVCLHANAISGNKRGSTTPHGVLTRSGTRTDISRGGDHGRRSIVSSARAFRPDAAAPLIWRE